MPNLTCYRLHNILDGEAVENLRDVLAEDARVEESDQAEGPGFVAQLFVAPSAPKRVPWANFVQQSFNVAIPPGSTPSALLIVRLRNEQARAGPLFAFPFGPGGRFLLRSEAIDRGYGLRTALNILYPHASSDTGRLRSVDSKRRGATVVRSRVQTSVQSDFELFDVNRLRDVLSKATGVPVDAAWGTRVSGGDALVLHQDIMLPDIGDLCRRISKAHRRKDYREKFGWIDDVRPVTDPALISELESAVLTSLRSTDAEGLSLAPPEIVDWDLVTRFRYHFDRRTRTPVLRPDMRLTDYANGLKASGAEMDELTMIDLRRSRIYGVDADENDCVHWPVWRCLVGEVQHHGKTYLLDEGEFFQVSKDYLTDLNAAIAAIPMSNVPLPPTTPTTLEGDYNEAAARGSDQLVLLDKKTVRVEGRTTPIEVCDLLTAGRQFIHVKRHLGSSDLSHLFAQGLVSAELLQSSVPFRKAARAKIAEAAQGRDGFDFVSEAGIATNDIEVVYAIAERWEGRTPVDALPFFSKVNLRETAQNLSSRGFKVGLFQIQA